MFVFATMLMMFSAVRELREARYLVRGWIGVGTLTAGVGVAQFTHKWLQAVAQHRDFYHFYLDQRITGFQNHWMTFSGLAMIAL